MLIAINQTIGIKIVQNQNGKVGIEEEINFCSHSIGQVLNCEEVCCFVKVILEFQGQVIGSVN